MKEYEVVVGFCRGARPTGSATFAVTEMSRQASGNNKKKAVSHVQTIESSSSRAHSFRHHSVIDFAEPDQGDRLVALKKTTADFHRHVKMWLARFTGQYGCANLCGTCTTWMAII
ncbi:hypothetical protein HFK74_04870|uniref:hypothetical protein n=1 Tax=Pseudomonas sp. SbOxS1 TaxID=2723884 RepID=UPI0015D18BD9|nr:hypothetical protein [Pseudomonas sp. SbOxS1]NYU02033.1 hypothetical protein [Pseudomonas sp. SbOxS1]